MGEKMTLLPCPFCGGEPETRKDLECSSWSIMCMDCTGHVGADSEDSAIDEWNSRHLATLAQTVDVEAVKTLLELVEGEHGGDHTEADCRHCVAFNKLAQAIGDKT